MSDCDGLPGLFSRIHILFQINYSYDLVVEIIYKQTIKYYLIVSS